MSEHGNVETAIGICLGASNVKVVELGQNLETGRISILRRLVRNHESNPRRVFRELVDELHLGDCELGVLTGRKFRGIVNAASIAEPEAIERALELTRAQGQQEARGANVLVSLGAESFIAYMLTDDGHISSVETGNKCASGTGEFFRQQIRRMDISTEEAVRLATGSEDYAVSGRCSVFCKSDCTHALNKGVPIGRVAAGLCQMMVEKVVDLLEKNERKDVIAVGGVTANAVVMDRLRERVDRLVIPEEAGCFEALGAAYHALVGRVRLGLDPSGGPATLFRERATSFSFLPPIRTAAHLVDFKPSNRGTAVAGDRCVVGLDVGSTTTKAVVLRLRDDAILADVYLRTNGDPVGASRRCYRELASQLGEVGVEIAGLGVTGSGRHIAGLHARAGAESIINEIVAHATGAAHFDPRVDTIFEIGGQDAKYTHLTGAVPSDYAMNEACSAGTGSFLEEAAQESLGIGYLEIEKIALEGERPPNFNDQCAAFISSDIKTATHEGIGREDVVAGLVYSICMNYANRVKGQRPVGDTIFMQGGVCYNKAVPLAMANLIERRIVVPPDPGLIGAFGVALEVKDRLAAELAPEQRFDLGELAEREIAYGRSFRCKGGKERCDRGCEIAMTIVDGVRIPFGGACNRYYNRRHRIATDAVGTLDLVRARQELVFGARRRPEPRPRPRRAAPLRVGLNRSYLTNTYFTLFHTFFAELGCAVVLPDRVDPDGVKKRRSSFCYPGEIAHGYFLDLLKKDPDAIFLPKVMSQQVKQGAHTAKERQTTCVLLQSEAYYLKSTFKNTPRRAKLITPILDFAGGIDSKPVADVFVSVARELGKSRRDALRAWRRAVDAHLEVQRQLKAMGRRALAELERTPDRTAVVILGRSYNGFAAEANMGIPTKFASRGVLTIPWDALPFEGERCDDEMCWAVGQELLKASAFVERHPQLFGAWVTNFSCGPDSFLVGYFRDIMKTKPSLTLELDSHTADAGVNTRVEAFLDIVQRYRNLKAPRPAARPFTPAQVRFGRKGVPLFVTSDGEEVSFLDRDRVHLLIPSMGGLSSELLAAVFNGVGVRADPVPVYTFEDLKLGRANTSCKECLPLQLVVGGLLQYLERRQDPDELLAYFMPFTPGNCRFPQYRVFIDSIIEKRGLRNVTQFSLNAEKGYSYKAFGPRERISVLKCFVVSDVMEDIKNALAVLAVDREAAARVFDAQWARVVGLFTTFDMGRLEAVLDDVCAELRRVPLRYPISEAKKVALMGEVFVRRDYFSAAELMDRLVANDIVVKKAHFFEWLKYVDAIVKLGIYEANFTLPEKIQFEAKVRLAHHYETQLKTILARSGLYDFEVVDIPKIFEYGSNFFDVRFRGESMLVVGSFFKDILHGYHGLVNIGPFACMPTRVIESVMSSEATLDVKRRLDRVAGHGDGGHEFVDALEGLTDLPFLTIEIDGNPLPQILEARIEAFCLQVDRLHGRFEPHRRTHQEPPAAASAPSLTTRLVRAVRPVSPRT